MAGIIYRNICAKYRLEVPKSKWEIPPKVLENDRAKILRDFQIQTAKQVTANQHCGGRQTTEEGSSDRCSNSKCQQHQEKENEKLGTAKLGTAKMRRNLKFPDLW